MSSRNQDASARYRLQITVESVTKVLFAVTLVLAFASLAGQVALRVFDWNPERHIVSFTNVDRERSLPTTFQALPMLGNAVALCGVAVMKKRGRDRWTIQWGILSVIFLLLAWVEISDVHEHLYEPMRRGFELLGFLFFSWIIPAGIAVALLALVFLCFFLALPLRTRTMNQKIWKYHSLTAM